MHLFLGGTSSACTAAYDTMAAVCGVDEASAVTPWRLSAFGALKTLWRRGLVEMDTGCGGADAEADCSYTCPRLDEDAAAERRLADQSSSTSTSTSSADEATVGVTKYLAALSPFGLLDDQLAAQIDAMSTDQRICVAKALCGAKVVTGDHIEAASPFDLSFWPVSARIML